MPNTATRNETFWQQLTAIALERDRLLTALKELAEAQRRMLVEGQHALLAENIQAQDQHLADLACLDQQEYLLVQDAPEDLKNSLAAGSRQYLALTDRSAQTARQLKNIVHGNRELFENAMQYVAFSLGALSNLAVDEPSYNPNLESPVNRAALMLDLKV